MNHMSKQNHYMEWSRNSYSLRFVNIITLCIAVIASIPQANIDITHYSPQVQRIQPLNPVPIASPSHIYKSTLECTELLSIIVLNDSDFEENLHTYSILEHCSSEHARIFISTLIYSQTTSSYL